MQKRASVCAETAALSTPQLARYVESWIHEGKLRLYSPKTLVERRSVTDKLLWFLRTREREGCGVLELRAFLAHVSCGHTEGGRWDNPANNQPVRPATALAYYRVLCTLFNWLVEEDALSASPFAKLKPPRVPKDQVQPFSADQVEALLAAAGKSANRQRDTALLLFLEDTGCRAGEVCGIRVGDLELMEKSVRVRGKGNKTRTIYYGRDAGRTLGAYLREGEWEPHSPLFPADRGRHPGEALTPNGLRQVVHRIGKVAGLTNVRCSPHTYRHTFAVNFLRNGGNLLELQQLLGHEDITVLRRYVALAQADLALAHRRFSPADNRRRPK